MSRTPDQAAALWRDRAAEQRYHALAETARSMARELFEAVNTCASRDDMLAVITGALIHISQISDSENESAIKAAHSSATKSQRMQVALRLRALAQELDRE